VTATVGQEILLDRALARDLRTASIAGDTVYIGPDR
jgi:hypothetical protein